MTFGERLRYLREERELRQKDIAEHINISPRMIGYYEADTNFPRDIQVILDLAAFFDVSIDYLFGVSNIKNDKIKNAFVTAFSDLSDENQKSALDYINYLRTKQRNEKQ